MKKTAIIYTAFFYILLFQSAFIYANSNKERIVLDTSNKPKDTTLFYRDGFGNMYKITADSLVYSPITMLESSSGTYNGGKHEAIPISKSEFNNIKQLFIAALKDTANHLQKMVKPHPVLTMQVGKKARRFILERNADINIEINTALNLLRK